MESNSTECQLSNDPIATIADSSSRADASYALQGGCIQREKTNALSLSKDSELICRACALDGIDCMNFFSHPILAGGVWHLERCCRRKSLKCCFDSGLLHQSNKAKA